MTPLDQQYLKETFSKRILENKTSPTIIPTDIHTNFKVLFEDNDLIVFMNTSDEVFIRSKLGKQPEMRITASQHGLRMRSLSQFIPTNGGFNLE